MDIINSDYLAKMTLHARKALVNAGRIASFCKQDAGPSHLLYAIFLEKGSVGSIILEDFSLKESDFKSALKIVKKNPLKNPISKSQVVLSNSLKTVVMRAFGLASEMGYPYCGSEHLVHAIIESKDETAWLILARSPLPKKEIKAFLPSFPGKNAPMGELWRELASGEFPQTQRIAPSSTSILEQFCTNLNEYALRSGDKISGRDAEITRIASILARKTKNNPLLIGDPGVGKTAIVEALAGLMAQGAAPAHLSGKKIYALDMTSVVAGTTFRGEFEQRLKDIIKEATHRSDAILFIDEVHSIVGAGNSQGGLDAANILKPALSRGLLHCIGATTHQEFKKHIEKDPALARRFQPLFVAEPTPDQTKEILKKTKKPYESFHGVLLGDEAINAAVDLSVRYIPTRHLPDKAIDTIDETAATLRSAVKPDKETKLIADLSRVQSELGAFKRKLISEGKYDEALATQSEEKNTTRKIKNLLRAAESKRKKNPITVKAEDIAKTISVITSIPLEKIRPSSEKSPIADIADRMEKKIIGQREAIDSVTATLMRSYAGIADPCRPIGSFVLLGPSGVGKTLLAKTLAEELFDDTRSLIRIDMSEFMEKHSVSRLIGAPAGYVGYEEGGKLAEALRRKPHSVLLFDEIEKAHPDIQNILLQILEEGILTDAQGNQVDFKSTIIFITSNIGSAHFAKQSEFGFSSGSKTLPSGVRSAAASSALRELTEIFRPELVSRLDKIIVMEPLKLEDLRSIAKRELTAIAGRLAGRGCKIKFAPDVSSHLASLNFNEGKGARGIRKSVRELIENELARHIILSEKSASSFSVSVQDAKVSIKELTRIKSR